MKTIKISNELHSELRKLQAHWEIKTIPETIGALLCFYRERMKEYDKIKK